MHARSKATTPRCAYCHDDAVPGARECRGCGTLLHDDCWSLAFTCPTLGCPLPLSAKIRVRLRGKGPTFDQLAVWIVLSGIVFAALTAVVPSFDKMFRETGLWLPRSTEVLVAVSRCVHSDPGKVGFVAFLLAGTWLHARGRPRPLVARIFQAMIVLLMAFFPFGVYALFAGISDQACSHPL